MAKLKVFVGSTAFDLADVRAEIIEAIRDWGYAPVSFEAPEFRVETGIHSHDVCLDGIEDCDIYLLVISKRYGGAYVGTKYPRFKDISITHAETKLAFELRTPVVSFVRNEIWNERPIIKANLKLGIEITPFYADSLEVYEFIDDIVHNETNNWIRQFSTSLDLKSSLRAALAQVQEQLEPLPMNVSPAGRAPVDRLVHTNEAVDGPKTEEAHVRKYLKVADDSNEQQQSAHSEGEGLITQNQVDDVGGDAQIINNQQGMSDGGMTEFVKGMEHISAEREDTDEQLHEALSRNKELKMQLADSIRRAEEGEQKGEPQAIAALAAVRETGDTEFLLKYLLALREGGVGDPTELNREIAAVAYLRGEIPTAQTALVQILDVLPDNMSAINMTGQIHALRGELEKAQAAYERILELANSADEATWKAAAYGNLGNVYRTRCELDKAEEMHLKSLAIEKQLGRKEGMASDYGNLGVVYETRWELDKAEEMYNKSLELNEQLGRKEGMASVYGNLGNIFLTRDELDTAEKMYNKALELHEQLGRKEGMAIQYGNLGIVYERRGELDTAEKMYKKALRLNKQLGRKEGMAHQYGNLGNVYYKRGEPDKAREYWILSRDLFNEIPMPHMVEKVQGGIDKLDAAQ